MLLLQRREIQALLRSMGKTTNTSCQRMRDTQLQLQQLAPTITLVYDESSLMVMPSHPAIEKALTFTEKTLGKDPKRPWEMKVTYAKRALYNIINEKPRTIQTFQGLRRRVLETIAEIGYNCREFDQRAPFPQPRWDLMFGFRCQQEELLRAALQKNESGMVEAPTRYGKTTLMVNTLRAFPTLQTVVAAPGADLVEQCFADLKEKLPKRKIAMLGAGSRTKYPSEDITVCSMDSLHKCQQEHTRLLLIDEPHAAVTNTRFEQFKRFVNARVLGFGATISGRFDKRDLVAEAIIGPTLARRTFREAVAEGAVAPITVFMIKIPYDVFPCSSRDAAYKKLFFKNEKIAKVIKWLSNSLIPAEWQALIFIDTEEQANYLQEHMRDCKLAMAKVLTKKDRAALVEQMKSAEIKRCQASDIFSTGVTFSDLRVVVMAAGGGGSISAIQKPGRIAEIRPNKRCGVVFDFLLVPNNQGEAEVLKDSNPKQCKWSAVTEDCWARFNAYKDRGYDIELIQNHEELNQRFQELCL